MRTSTLGKDDEGDQKTAKVAGQGTEGAGVAYIEEEFADDEGDSDAETDVTQSVLSDEEGADRSNRRDRSGRSRSKGSFVRRTSSTFGSDLEEGNEEEEEQNIDTARTRADRTPEGERTSHKRTPSEEIRGEVDGERAKTAFRA